jgi:DNA-binding transcriptional ArsR family regulator
MQDVDLAAGAAPIADPARAAMLDALMDGAPRSAGALAREAGVAASTASHHLGRLLDAGLVVVEPDGRRRAFRLARSEVADALEALALISPPRPTRTLRTATRAEAERAARTCYDHLAGKLGVSLADALVERGHVEFGEDGGVVTPAGSEFLSGFGVDLATRTRRAFCRPCIDWSERRPHIAGAVGAALAARCFDLGWLQRIRDTRAVTVTAKGRAGLRETFGIDFAPR